MNDPLKSMFDDYLTPDEDASANAKNDELNAPAGFVDTVTPYDRLRRSMRRMFPFYPDVFDINGQPRRKDKD